MGTKDNIVIVEGDKGRSKDNIVLVEDDKGGGGVRII